MSEDVFGKLRDLHGEVRARIEASPDWKCLQAVERAMGEVKTLLPVMAEPVVSEAAEPVAVTAEPVAEAAVETAAPESAEAPADAASEAAPEATSEAVAEANAEAAPEASPSTPTEETPVPAELETLVADITATVPEAAPAANGTVTH